MPYYFNGQAINILIFLIFTKTQKF